ncbi:MAG: TetR/AcrR family transcriptional regulator [Acidimicrobiales bacterium]
MKRQPLGGQVQGAPAPHGCPRPAGQRASLTRQRIVEAALQIIDAEGLEALSMRHLGSQLGVEAMAIYHHFLNKEAVLDAVLGHVLGDGEDLGSCLEGACAGWEERLRLIWVRFRDRFRQHPNALPLVFTHQVLGTRDLVQTEMLLSALFDAGLPARRVVDAWRALGAYVIGYLSVEALLAGRPQGAPDADRRPADLERFPAWQRVLPHLDRGWDEQFASALSMVLEGIRASVRR